MEEQERETQGPLPSETEFLREAKAFLDNPSLLIKIANVLGVPLEKAQKLLPENQQKMIAKATTKALETALEAALRTSTPAGPAASRAFDEQVRSSTMKNHLHTAGSAISGAIGGFFGPISMIVELPLSTTIILRSITETARDFGFDLDDPKVKAECLFVFTLGSKESDADDEMNSAYLASRVGFAASVRNAASYIAANSIRDILSGLERHTAPLLAKFLSQIAARFNIVITQKAMMEAVPVLGAAGGMAINSAFADYFGRAARYHFGILALEKKYGEEKTRELYQRA